MAFEFKFPDDGEGIHEGELVKWLVNEGDFIKEDQAIAKIETDKAIVEIPSPKSGKVLKLHFKEGDTIKVGETLVTIGEEGEKVSVKTPERKTTSVVGELEESEQRLVIPKKEKREIFTGVLATPLVRALAKELNVDINTVRGTGDGGRITEEDVRNSTGKEIKKEVKVVRKYNIYGYVERIHLKGVRKAVAKKMVESVMSAVHVVHIDEADVTELSILREKEKIIASQKGVKLTFMPYIIKAVIDSLKQHPYLNSTLEGEEIVLKKYYNIGIAVDTEDGLIVPVIKIADSKSLYDLAKEVENLAELARERKLDLGDMQGGTFTITNIGSIRGLYATPIINYPEAAILGLGRIYEKPVAIGGKVQVRNVLPLSLSFDHRILDGAEAAKFIDLVIKHLENPDMLMVK